MALDLSQIEYELWNIVFLPVLSVAALSVLNALRAPAVAFNKMHEKRLEAINKIEGEHATPIVVEIVESLLPRVAWSYIDEETGSGGADPEERRQELSDRLASQGNVAALGRILDWGGRWCFLKSSHEERVRLLRIVGLCGLSVFVFTVPLALEAMTPKLKLLPDGWLIATGGALVIACTCWGIAAMAETIRGNRFAKVLRECE